jgi:hypothetical protein
LTSAYGGGRESQVLSQRTGVKVLTIPHDIGTADGTGSWIEFMNTVVRLLQ